MPVPAFFWQLSCAAAGLLVCVLPIAVPSLPWADDISSPISSAENPAQAEYDPAADYRVLSQELAQMGLEQEEIHLLWNRMGSALSQKLEAGELSPADISYLALPYGREDCLARYAAYAQSHPELDLEEVVLQVNMGLDRPFYEDVEVISDPGAPDVLVNKYHILPSDFVPELVPLTGLGAGSLTAPAAEAFRQMVEAAKADGISLRSVSAYRSYQTQSSLYRRYAAQNGQALADTFSARAGSSEHQTGLALDINVATIKAHFENTATYAWLVEHCADYGFILRYPEDKQDITGYRFEPWHYRYVGVETARICMEQNWTYEEYLARLPVDKGSQAPILIFQEEVLDLGGISLMLDGELYVSAAPLAQALGWSAAGSEEVLMLSGQGREVLLQPWRRCHTDGAEPQQTSPVMPLEGGLYLPLDELCAVLGLEMKQTQEGVLTIAQPV